MHYEQLTRMQSHPSTTKPVANASQSPLIHLVAGDIEQAENLASPLRVKGFQLRVFTAVEDFRTVCFETECPDAIVFDISLDGDKERLHLLAGFNTRGQCSPPLVVVSAHDDLDMRLAAYRAGAKRYLRKPVAKETLIELLNTLTGRQPAVPYRVLIVDNDPALLGSYSATLKAAGMDTQTLSAPLQTLNYLESFRPDVLLIGLDMPQVSGPELAAVLCERDDFLQLPILFLSAENDVSEIPPALVTGGDGFLSKATQPEHLVSEVAARARRARERNASLKRLQATLYEREQERLAVDHHSLVSVADASGTIIDVNRAFCEVSGYSREELIGQNHRIIKSGQHPPDFYLELWVTISSGQVWQGEICNRRKDGSLYWVASTIMPFLGKDGIPYQYVSIRTDITAIKAAEAAAKDSEAMTRNILDSMPSNIAVLDPDGVIIAVNSAWQQYGLENASEPGVQPPRTGVGIRYLDSCIQIPEGLPDSAREAKAGIQAVLAGNAPYFRQEYPCHSPNRQRWFEMTVTRLGWNSPGVVVIHTDITHRIKAEHRARETEQRFSFAVEGAGDGVWDWNVKTGRMVFSAHYEPMLGYQPGELAPRMESWTDLIHPEDITKTQRELTACMAGNSTQYNQEFRLRCKDGQYKWILCRGTVVQRDADGEAVRMIGIHSDISARKQAEQALVAAREEAERANRAKSEFLSSMSHELRTPMNAILGFGQLLESDESLEAELRENVGEILRAGRHLLELINEVLDLAKVESGNLDISLERLGPLEVERVVEECLSLVTPSADKRHIQLRHQGGADAVIRADRIRLKQALLNLLSNAVKYNREGGSITLDIRREGDAWLSIRVTDTGPGIGEDKLESLFLPFHRLEPDDSGVQGTGIGLTITQRIMELMSGRVRVFSQTGVGSTFCLEFPLESASRAINTKPPSRMPTFEPEPEKHIYEQIRAVLYIEDNPANLRLVERILGRLPQVRLITAHTPQLGIDLALAHRPALILLDINLPGLDGYRVLETFKAEPSLESVPVIAITANAMPSDVERGMAAGFKDYLTKPLDIPRFISTVNSLIGGDTM